MMDKNYRNGDVRWKLFLLLLASSAIPAMGFSQSDALEEEDIYVLSPFEVNVSEDVGYMAENTLSGSRLNTSLKDVPAVIDISTKELIEDLGVNDFQELMEYQGNTQVHDFEENGATNSGTFNTSLPNERVSYRTRGFSSTNTQDFVNWNSPDDTYNVDRYDFSKGPNGVLFGLGSVGGTSNATTKRAMVHKDFGNVVLQFGSWDHKRASIDLNKSLGDGKFGFRLNALEQDSGGYRYGAFKKSSRIAVAGTWKIAQKTTFRVAYEDGDKDSSNYRPFGPSDQFSEYVGEGFVTPTYNNGRINVDNDNGITSSWANTRIVAVDGGSTYNELYSPRSTAYNDKRNADPFRANYGGRFLSPDKEAFGEYAISDRIAMEGPTKHDMAEWDKMLVTLEHAFTDKLNAELTFYNEDLYAYGQNPGGSGVYVDLVENHGDPTSDRPYNNPIGVNDHYGDFYMENVWRTNEHWRELKGYRATLAYEFDFADKLSSKWGSLLGRHRIAGMVEQREERIARENTYEVLTTESRLAAGLANTNTNAEHTRNRIWRRNYVTFGDWENFHTGDFPSDMTVSMPMADGSTQMLDTTFVPTGQNAISDDMMNDLAYMFALQNFWWNNRLVTTFGYREDDVDVDRMSSVRDTVGNIGYEDYDGDGMVGEWVLRNEPEYQTTTEIKGITRTMGIVGHVTDNLSLFANHSSGRKLPSVGQQIAPDGRLGPGESGKSFDYGITFNLFDRKISGRINRFESEGYDRFIWSNSGAPGVAVRILDAIRSQQDPTSASYISDSEYDEHTPTFNGGLADTWSEGYEFRLIGNPTKNLRLMFNYSYSKRRFENVLLNNYEWMINEADYYSSKLAELGMNLDSDIMEWNSDGIIRTTANDAIGLVLGRVTRDQLLKGLGFNERPHKVNFTANYKFTDGVLKGFSIGGSARWQDKSVIDAEFDYVDLDNDFVLDYNEVNLDEDGIIDVKQKYESKSTFMADMMMKYNFPNAFFGDRVRAEVQLNIKNIFDNTDILPSGMNNAFSGVSQYRFQEPRSYRLTMRLRF